MSLMQGLHANIHYFSCKFPVALFALKAIL